MLFNFFADRYVTRAIFAFALSTACLAAGSVSARVSDAEVTQAANLGVANPHGEKDDRYHRLKIAVKDRCRYLSNRWESSFSAGPSNGRVAAARPAKPSPREQCIRQGLRDGRADRNEATADQPSISGGAGR